MISFGVTAHGMGEVQRMLGRVTNAGLRQLMPILGEELVRGTLESFDEERTPYGEAWEPLASSTVRQKGSSRILVETGRLRDSLAFEVRDNTTVIVGSDVEYGVFHQLGTRRMPRRAFLPDHGLPNEVQDRLLEKADTWLMGLFREP